jgi:hypothetical protein
MNTISDPPVHGKSKIRKRIAHAVRHYGKLKMAPIAYRRTLEREETTYYNNLSEKSRGQEEKLKA